MDWPRGGRVGADVFPAAAVKRTHVTVPAYKSRNPYLSEVRITGLQFSSHCARLMQRRACSGSQDQSCHMFSLRFFYLHVFYLMTDQVKCFRLRLCRPYTHSQPDWISYATRAPEYFTRPDSSEISQACPSITRTTQRKAADRHRHCWLCFTLKR